MIAIAIENFFNLLIILNQSAVEVRKPSWFSKFSKFMDDSKRVSSINIQIINLIPS